MCVGNREFGANNCLVINERKPHNRQSTTRYRLWEKATANRRVQELVNRSASRTARRDFSLSTESITMISASREWSPAISPLEPSSCINQHSCCCCFGCGCYHCPGRSTWSRHRRNSAKKKRRERNVAHAFRRRPKNDDSDQPTERLPTWSVGRRHMQMDFRLQPHSQWAVS